MIHHCWQALRIPPATRQEEPVHTASLPVGEFHYTSESCESCWWNASPKWGNQAAFRMTHLDPAAKPKLALLCSMLFPSQRAWCISEKLIQPQICWTNTVIIWSSGAFVIKLGYLCQKGRRTACLEDDLLFLRFRLIKDTRNKRDSCVFNWCTRNIFASKLYRNASYPFAKIFYISCTVRIDL